MRIAIVAAVALALVFGLAGPSRSAGAFLTQDEVATDGPAVSPLDAALREALAAYYCRRAVEACQIEPATSHAFQLAAELFREADSLDADEVEILRAYLAVATLSEDGATRSVLLERLSRLDPDDERVRLARINDVLSRYDNAEELVDAYLVILRDDNIRKLGAPVASRLATALAVLYERLGDAESYATWISRASTLDPSNKEAASLMVGYFQQHVADDPFGQAELLVNLLLADPIDLMTQTALARHLLEHGAYEGAVRLHRLAIDTHAAFRQGPAPDFVADLVLAEWGSGDSEAAHRTIQAYQQLLDEGVRMRAWNQNPKLGPEERAQLTSPLPATLAAVHIAMLDLSDPAAVPEAHANVQATFTNALTNAPADVTAEQRQELLLAQAWLASWFGGDGAAIQSLVDQAVAAAPIDETTRRRFDVWIAFRSADFARTEELLSSQAPESDATQLAALALLRVEQGRPDEAAEAFATIASQVPASALGLWARQRAQLISGVEPPAPPLAARLNELAASIPRSIDRIPTDRQFTMSLRIEPVDPPFEAFGPMPVRLIIFNYTGLPIGISPEGPLRPNVIIESDISAPSQPRLGEGPPIVVDCGTRLRLAPRESLEIVIDLRRRALADFLEACGPAGASVQLRGVLNPFPANESLIDAGALGGVTRSIDFRVNGARISAEWIAAVAARIRATEVESLQELGLLIQAILSGGASPGRAATSDITAALADASAALEQSFPQFDPLMQAWVVSIIPRDASALPAILDLARQSTSADVLLAYLVNHLGGADDPVLATAKQHEDADVARIAGIVRSLLDQQAAAENMANERARQQTGTPPGGAGSGR